MNRPEHGRALFYTRDSGGKHETTPGQYVEWATLEARKSNLRFCGTALKIEEMMRNGISVDGDLFLDYGVSGNRMSRPGLDALKLACTDDLNVSRVLIPMRDRLARPDDPIEGLQLENFFTDIGITLHFQEKIVLPGTRGRRPDAAQAIAAYMAYDQSGRFRTELARKVLLAKSKLAVSGFASGGRAPYGFRRWLIHEDGTPVRQLSHSENVRMAHHHVAWLPGPDEELRVIKRILAMVATMPASQVAAILTSEGVPTPDAGRTRMDRGVRHGTSGAWHAGSVTSIARNPLLSGITTFNRRGMGDQLRLEKAGLRELSDSDYRTDGQPKVVTNSAEDHITAKAHFDALVPRDTQDQLISILDDRGATQRGRPRSRDPDRNPLGGRVFDFDCSWPMYRAPYKDGFRYICGRYTQSHGQQCAYNHVDGVAAAQFVLSCIQQRLSGLSGRFKERLGEIAKRELAPAHQNERVSHAQNELARVKADLIKVGKNLALADNEDQHCAIAAEFDRIKQKEKALLAELALPANRRSSNQNIDSEIEAAMRLMDRMSELATDPANLPAIAELFKRVDVRLFLQFKKERRKKRMLNVLTGGVLTLGSAAPPIQVYQGPTSRYAVKDAPAVDQQEPVLGENVFGSGREGNSLGNINRGDMI